MQLAVRLEVGRDVCVHLMRALAGIQLMDIDVSGEIKTNESFGNADVQQARFPV